MKRAVAFLLLLAAALLARTSEEPDLPSRLRSIGGL